MGYFSISNTKCFLLSSWNFCRFGSFACCEREIVSAFSKPSTYFLFWQVWTLLWLTAWIIMRDCGPGKAGELMLAGWWDHYTKSMLNLKMRLQSLTVSHNFFFSDFQKLANIPQSCTLCTGIQNPYFFTHWWAALCTWFVLNVHVTKWKAMQTGAIIDQIRGLSPAWNKREMSLLAPFPNAIMYQCPSLHTALPRTALLVTYRQARSI